MISGFILLKNNDLDIVFSTADTISYYIPNIDINRIDTNDLKKIVYEKSNLNQDSISHIKTLIIQSNCMGIFWLNSGSINIHHSGLDLIGSFNYYFKSDKDTTSIKESQLLKDNIYWRFFQSGLWCAQPIYISDD